MVCVRNIRNFSIIAHIDHGKSTLADRLIQKCGGLTDREMREQILDSMDLEKERGITIKAQTVRLSYRAHNSIVYQLNLIDTPGHVDFSYEVGRSLAACEGSLLIIDATQGVEAQTLANVYQAIEAKHEILLVLNKIDLPSADIDRVCDEVESIIGIDAHDALLISAKTGVGIDDVLESIVQKLPAPTGDPTKPLKALLIDSWYDNYMGVVALVRMADGVLKPKQSIRMVNTDRVYTIDQLGIFTPKKQLVTHLMPGEIGFFVASIKQVGDVRVGDTIVDDKNPRKDAFPNFKPVQSVVFCSIFPVDASDFTLLRSAIEKLHLNDASFFYEMETSVALGFGFRCGFLGLLHLEIIKERIEREFNMSIITTAPSVVYQFFMKDGTVREIHNPSDVPDSMFIDHIEEPRVLMSIMTPNDYMGAILALCESRRGIQKNMDYKGSRVVLKYDLPLNEIVFDFHDRLKSATRGYASFDYYITDHRPGDLVKMNILINEESIDALAMIVHKEKAESRGRAVCEKLKEIIPRHLFKIPIQAAIGAHIIARETISPLRKDVTAKCYGGDITRKRKLLEKQKEGKKKMRQFGKVDIPQEAFIQVLKNDE